VIDATSECGVVMCSVASVCLSVCLSVCNALIFESFDVESSFLLYRYTLEYLGPFQISRSYGEGQGHVSKNGVLCVLFGI